MRSLVIGGCLFLLGILILAAKELWLDPAKPFSHIVEEVAIAVIIAGVLETVWELFRKRRFLTEVKEALCKDDSVLDAGIKGIVTDLYREIDWERNFNSSSYLAVAFVWGSTWRGQNSGRVRAFVKRPKTTLKVLLPDFRCDGVIESFSRSFSKSVEATRDRIIESFEFFLEIRKEVNEKSTVEIYLTTRPLTWTAYVFKESAIWCMYTHGNQKGTPPHFILERAGGLYAHVSLELNHYFNKQNPVTEVAATITTVKQFLESQR